MTTIDASTPKPGAPQTNDANLARIADALERIADCLEQTDLTVANQIEIAAPALPPHRAKGPG